MEGWQERVIQERNDLYEKLTKLILFEETTTFQGLSDYEKLVFSRQQYGMTKYLNALDERILRFT